MKRRTFLGFSMISPFAAMTAPEVVAASELGLCELATTEYEYIFRDFKERHPDHYLSLRKAPWAITDLVWASRDGSHPQHRQLTVKEEFEFEQEHGFKPTYYWRDHAIVAKQLLQGEASCNCELTFKDDDVTIYTHDYSDNSIGLMYVFHKKRSVGRVLCLKDKPC